jgi:hypothetical protein
VRNVILNLDPSQDNLSLSRERNDPESGVRAERNLPASAHPRTHAALEIIYFCQFTRRPPN